MLRRPPKPARRDLRLPVRCPCHRGKQPERDTTAASTWPPEHALASPPEFASTSRERFRGDLI